MSKQTLYRGAALAAAMALAMPCVNAAPPQPGMTVVRDPESGQLRAPTPAELRELQGPEMARRTMAPSQRAQPTIRPDGTRGVVLGERGMVYSVVTRGQDGKLHQQCVQGEDAAAHAADPAATPSKEHNHDR